jgi:hypothetical protein
VLPAPNDPIVAAQQLPAIEAPLPIALVIPSIGVQASLINLGLVPQ